MGKVGKYDNVTVSGLPGAGSSTLARQVAQVMGWKYFSGGDFLRAYAIENGWFDGDNKLHHDQSIMPDEADKLVDYGMRKKVSEGKGNVLDSWLSGFMTQGVGGVLKVLVVCSDNAVRIDRIVNRDEVDVAEAKKHIFDREKKNREKWERMYAKEWREWVVEKGLLPPRAEIDFWHPSLYDLVIDTFSNSKTETLEKVMEVLENKD
jgi:cytidylate kinase